MADQMVGKRIRAVVDLGGLDLTAGDEFTVNEKIASRFDIATLIATGAAEVVKTAKAAPTKPETKPTGKAGDAR